MTDLEDRVDAIIERLRVDLTTRDRLIAAQAERLALLDRMEGHSARAVESLSAEVQAMRGRQMPPTLAEIKAHEANGGAWIYGGDSEDDLPIAYRLHVYRDEVMIHSGARTRVISHEDLPSGGRWWCWRSGHHHGPGAWPVVPVVTEQTAG